MSDFQCIISEESEEERIDKFISDEVEGLSRSYIQTLLKDQKIFVNMKPVKSSYRLRAGDEITFSIPEATSPEIVPEDIPLSILFEDKDLLIVNNQREWSFIQLPVITREHL